MYIFAQCYCINAISVCTVLFFSLLTCIQLCVWCLCVWGGWTKAMCLVRSHTNGVSLLQIMWTIDNQMYKMCLVSNRPATSSLTLGIITQSHWSGLLFHLGSVRSTHSDTIELAQAVQRVRCALIDKKTNKQTSVRLFASAHEAQAQPLTSLSTNGEFHHAKPSQYQKRLFAINVHCKKNNNNFFTCILYFAPLSFYSCAELPL